MLSWNSLATSVAEAAPELTPHRTRPQFLRRMISSQTATTIGRAYQRSAERAKAQRLDELTRPASTWSFFSAFQNLGVMCVQCVWQRLPQTGPRPQSIFVGKL